MLSYGPKTSSQGQIHSDPFLVDLDKLVRSVRKNGTSDEKLCKIESATKWYAQILKLSPLSQSSLFSQYFASIFKIFFSFVPNNLHPLLPLLTNFDNSQQTIEKICENLDFHNAKGLDEIHAIVYKRCSRAVSKSLNQIFYKLKQNRRSEIRGLSHYSPAIVVYLPLLRGL